MIPIIKRYIYEHIDNWPVKIQQPLSLRPLLLSNVNYNFIENYPLISRVILWFGQEDNCPRVVSKIMDRSLKLESIKRCIRFQATINEKIGYDVFPRIFDIAEISGDIILFQEAVKRSTYETELKYAICGPERSLPRLERVIQRQFKEMGGLFRDLQNMRTSDKPQKWGDWAYKLGQDFRNTCGFDAKLLTDAHLDKMRRAIDSVPLYQTPVLADFVCPNIFSGPRLIDNINPNIDKLNAQLPGIINVFRFIIPYFYSPPVRHVFKDWLYAIAVAITDREGQTIIGPPVRGILRQVGLEPEQPKVIWAFVMATTLFEMKDKLEFYSESPFMIGGKKDEFQQWTKRLVEIQKFISRNKKFDSGPIILAQNSLRMQELPASSSSQLIEEGYKGFNIISCGDKFYGLAQEEGAFNINRVKNNQYKKCFVSTSIGGVKDLIDRFEVQNYYNLGFSYLKLKEFDKAQAAFEKTLILLENIVASSKKEAFVTTPNQSALVDCYVSSSMRLVSCFIEQGKYKKIEEVLTKLKNNEYFKVSPDLKRKIRNLMAKYHKLMGESY